MPAKTASSTSGISAADIEAKLPKGFFVRRGQVRDAFGLTDEDMGALVPEVFRPQYLPPNKRKGKKRAKSRAVFVRSQVVAVARKWEGAS